MFQFVRDETVGIKRLSAQVLSKSCNSWLSRLTHRTQTNNHSWHVRLSNGTSQLSKYLLLLFFVRSILQSHWRSSSGRLCVSNIRLKINAEVALNFNTCLSLRAFYWGESVRKSAGFGKKLSLGEPSVRKMLPKICLVVALACLCIYLYGVLITVLSSEKNNCKMTYMFEYPQFVVSIAFDDLFDTLVWRGDRWLTNEPSHFQYTNVRHLVA